MAAPEWERASIRNRSLRQDKTLVIDPAALVYSTYLGGSLTDAATSIAVDSSGDAYITGFTASTNFPVTSDVYQPQCNGCTTTGTNNAFITELDPTGSILVYSTYLGGNNGDSGNGIAIDASGDAYVVGATFSKISDDDRSLPNLVLGRLLQRQCFRYRT